jgi:hypothetical protein
MVTKGDKIAFALIAVLFVLAIVFRRDIASVFDGGEGKKERKENKERKDDGKEKKKEGRLPSGGPGQTVFYTVRA